MIRMPFKGSVFPKVPSLQGPPEQPTDGDYFGQISFCPEVEAVLGKGCPFFVSKV